VETGDHIHKSTQTLADFLQKWLDTYVATNTSLRTQQGYRHYVKRHIGATIGNIKLQGLTAPQIQGLYAKMLEQGLSNRTVLHCHRVLKQALGFAVQWGDLAKNPADGATPPRPQDPELKTWDADTFHSFLTAGQDSQFRDLYHLAALTGMRRSELCGLKWGDIDLDGAALRVVRTLQRIDGRGLVEGRPKTERSRRTIALSPSALEVLRRVRAMQSEDQLRLGSVWQGRGYVFTNEDGTPLSGERVSKDFANIVRQAKLPHLTLHGLRHTAASLMIAGGVHARTIADILGHSSISTTMDVYGHLISGVQEDAVSVLDQRLTGNGSS
jgi:integrase